MAPLMDRRVELHGTSHVDLNGKCGIATDFHYYKADQSNSVYNAADKRKWRYTVQLDGGEAFKVKLANVRAEGVGDGSGGGGAGTAKAKAKGKKGKKGRGGRK